MAIFKINGLKIDLNNNNFISHGGEGSVYAKNNLAYKIYHNPNGMIPVGKIQELSVIKDDRVIKPQDIIYKNNTPVGYTMRFVQDTHPLCKTFTKAFRNREKLDIPTIVNLIKGMKETVELIHGSNILIVDLNEMNFLVEKGFTEVYFIDVDSYQTKSYPATAIMESIRDRHSKLNCFSEETDWFAYAVVTFQMLIGIHPYKGKHPKLKGFEDRMLANMSVFNNEVSLPKTCYPFDVIPKALKDWYLNVFESTFRGPPPDNFDLSGVLTSIKVSKVCGSNNFDITELLELDEDIKQFVAINNSQCVVTEKSVYFNGNKCHSGSNMVVGIYEGVPYTFEFNGPNVLAKNVISGPVQKLNFNVDKFFVYDGRVYGKSYGNILEFKVISGMVVASRVASVLPMASEVYPGVVIQDMLGLYVVSVFPESGKNYQYKLKELNGYSIVDAKFDSGVLIIVASINGRYDKFLFNLDKTSYKLFKKVEDILYTGLNFVVLDSGIFVSINENDEVVAFNIKQPNKIKIVKDNSISGDFRLFKNGGTVVFSNDNRLFKLKMR
jgi:serine/threonine protein kinase